MKVVQLVVNIHWSCNIFVNPEGKLADIRWTWYATFVLIFERCFLYLVTLYVKGDSDGQEKSSEKSKDCNSGAKRRHWSQRRLCLLQEFIFGKLVKIFLDN